MIGFGYAFDVVAKEFIKDVSSLGSLAFYLLAILVTFMIGEYGLSYRLIVSLATVFIVTYSIKFFYIKPRPDFRKKKFSSLLERLNESSFPSVHAARITVLSAVLYSIFPQVLSLSLLLVITVACSRIMMKRHYLTDVIAGTAMGLIISYFVFL